MGRADPVGHLAEAFQIETEETGGVAAEHRLDLDRIDSGEREPKGLVAERVADFLVGVVAAPHDLVYPDRVAHGCFRRAHEAGSDVALAGPVLAGSQ